MSLATDRVTDLETRGNSTIPPELADYIIDFLHGDKDALRQCSLVCRGWLPASSLHLFRQFRWPPCYHAYSSSGRSMSHQRCKCAFLDHSHFWSELLDFIRGSRRVQDYVRKLQIYFQWTVVDLSGWGTSRTEYHHKVTLSTMKTIVDNLPQLEWLYLTYPHFLQDVSPINHSSRSMRALGKLTIDCPAPPLASDDRLDMLSEFLHLFSHISLLQLKDVMRHRADYRLAAATDRLTRPRIDSLRVDTSTSLAFVQYLRIVTTTADPTALTNIVVNNLIGNVPVPETIPLLRTLSSLRSLTLDGLYSACLLDRNMVGLFPALQALTISGVVMVESNSVSTWGSLRGVAECPIPSVGKLVLRFTLEGSRLEPPMPVLDGDIRYSLRALNWALLDAVIGAYSNVILHFQLDRKSLALSKHHSHVLLLVESVAKDRMSVRARQSVHLQAGWKDNLDDLGDSS